MSDKSSYKILVVEDTIDVARITMLTLQRLGYTNAFHAEHGEQALAYLQDNQPDVVLLDLNLPGMSGWEIAQEMYKLYDRKSIKIIVTSAYGDNPNRVIGRLQDVFKYLIKPFSPSELGDAIDEALGIHA